MAKVAFDFPATRAMLGHWPDTLRQFQSTISREYYESETTVEMPSPGDGLILSRAAAGPLTIMRYRSPGHTDCRRSHGHIRSDHSDFYMLWFVASGSMQISQNGRTVEVAADAFAVTSAALPFRMRSSPGAAGFHESFQILVPAHIFAELVEQPDDVCARSLPRSAGARLADTVFTSLFEQGDGIAPDIRGRMALAALDAVGAAIRDARGTAPGRLIDERLQRVLEYIERNMGDHTLGAARVASSCNVSVRYLHELFTHHDRTFQDHVRHVRLNRAKELLESERSRARLISEICNLVGFRSNAHFSRAFRTKFGCSPSDVRAALSRAVA